MSGGGGTTTSNTSTTVPPDVLAEYNKVVAQANQVAGAPLNQYHGPVVAGQTPAETSAYNTINNMQGMTGPVTASQIQGYESPYTKDVLNTTIAAENNQDAQQQQQLEGNAISAGAWGGDRAGVAQGILGGQQAYANNATNAGIANQGYSQALQEANTQQENTFNNTLTGANAQLTAGQLQQQQAQSELNVPYEQFLQQQAYPFQTTGWLGNIAEGIGSNEGGTSTSSTTAPSQGLFGLQRGGGITRYAAGGSKTPGVAAGYDKNGNSRGVPWAYNSANPNAIDPPNGNTFGVVAPQPAAPASISSGPSGGAHVAPTYAEFAASGGLNSGAPYTGGAIAGMDAASQADLESIYGSPVHHDSGGATDGQGGTPEINASQGIVQHVQQIPQRLRLQQMQQGQSYGTGNTAAMTIPSFPTMKRGGIVQHFDDGGATQVNSAPPIDSDWNVGDSPQDMQAAAGLAAINGQEPYGGITPPPPTPPVNAPDHPINAGYTSDMPTTHEANPWLAVAAGVAGTLAGRSRNPLVDIGQGALIGLNNYTNQQVQAEKQNYEEGTFHQNAQKLMDEAQMEKDKLGEEKLRDFNTDKNQQGELGIKGQELHKPVMVKDIMGNDIGWATPGSSKIQPLTGLPDYMSPTGGAGATPTASPAPAGGTYGPTIPAVGGGSVGERVNSKLLSPYTSSENIDAAVGKFPPAVATHAEMIASGEEPWPTVYVAAKSPVYSMATTLARQINPGITAAAYPTYLDFAKGPSSNIVKSLDVAIPHLDTLSGLVDALGNGDTKAVNAIGNVAKTQLGLSTAPTNFDAAKQIVANEVVKAVIGSGGGVTDREAAQAQLNKANSPALLKGVIQTYKSLMNGQMQGLQQKYESATGRNDFQTHILGHKAQAELTQPAEDSATPKVTNWVIKDGKLVQAP